MAKQRRTTTKMTLNTYHEAGHAVVAAVIGMNHGIAVPVRCVRILPDGGDCEYLRIERPEDGDLITLAGYVAEFLLMRRWTDTAMLPVIVGHTRSDTKSLKNQVTDRLLGKVFGILFDNWWAVDEIARQLRERRYLSAWRVYKVLKGE
jgi:hypothetical protein